MAEIFESIYRLPTALKNAVLKWNYESYQDISVLRKHFAVCGTDNARTAYHYTTPASFRGILESSEFWLTSYRYVNDPSEIAVGLELARHELSDGHFQFLAELFNSDQPLSYDVFVGSFSEHRDSLGQWRAYGDNGRGICIGFNTESIVEGDGAVVCGKVQYDDSRNQWDETAASLTMAGFCGNFKKIFFWNDQAMDELQKVAANEIAGVSLDGIANLFRQHLLFQCSLLKHGAYTEEQEWRIAIIRGAAILAGYGVNIPVKTRLRGYQEIPYLALPLPSRRAIKEVMLGPATTERDRQLVERLLKEFGYKDVIPSKSLIPFRPT